MMHYHNCKISVNNESYKIIGKLGSGKKSKVYKALECSTNRLVAVKTQAFKADSNVDSQKIYRQQFLTELWSLEKLLNNYRVVNLYNSELFDQKGSIVMELGKSVPGVSRISKYVKEPNRGVIWSDMVQATASVHREGIIHADIKPQNFIMTNDGIKIIDFGYALPIDVHNHNCGHQVVSYFRGTIDYVSPEVLISKPFGIFSQKCDVWALGCILFEMTFGKSYLDRLQYAFSIDKQNFIINAMNKLSIPMTKDEDLYDLIYRCLQLNPQNRPCIEQVLAHRYTHSLIHPYNWASSLNSLYSHHENTFL
ncbi:hypothetical protein GJ496_009451 [Pomphorhynchus laevis]|nr:hypothetical protein GJ496_009451 [Pomphorhynchus laevis]